MYLSWMSLLAALLATACGCHYNLTEMSVTHYHLSFDDCNITHIPRNVFDSTQKLISLDLRRNVIDELVSSNYEGLESLEALYLSENQLTSLPDDFLHFMTPLQKLLIKENPLEVLSANALSGSNLTELFIESNLVPLTVASRALADMSRLTVITLINCNITSLPGDLLDGSDVVEDIDLSNNHITHLPADIFANKSSLKTLFIHDNQLLDLSPATFASLHNVWWLNLDYNKISEIRAGTFFSMNKLQILWIRYNRLRVISPDAFPVSLSHLGLGGNELKTLKTHLLPELVEISLHYNSLSRVPQHWPETLPKLKFIYLYKNAFTLLTESDMAVLSHYPKTSVEHNNIETILVDQNTTKISELWLAGVPLRCDCWMHRFATILRNNTDKVRNAYCANPGSLNRTKLIDVPLIDLVCHLETCPDNCTCVVKPETKALMVECRKKLTTEQVIGMENLRQKIYGNITETLSLNYVAIKYDHTVQ